MKILDLVQGSEEWKAERRKWLTASDVPSVLGVPGAYSNRDKVLKEKVSGEERVLSDFEEALFAEGHAAEIPLREAATQALGFELEQAVVLNEALGILASLDGTNFARRAIVEMKYSGAAKVLELARQGVPFEPYRVQIMAQMMATGFREAYLFVLEKESGDAHLIQVEYCEKTAQRISEASKSFHADLAAGRTNEIEIRDKRMDRLAALLQKERDILSEIQEPMALLDQVKEESDAIKKAIAEEFAHNTILGSGVRITKSKPSETLDKAKMVKAGIDLSPFIKLNKPAVRAVLVGES